MSLKKKIQRLGYSTDTSSNFDAFSVAQVSVLTKKKSNVLNVTICTIDLGIYIHDFTVGILQPHVFTLSAMHGFTYRIFPPLFVTWIFTINKL